MKNKSAVQRKKRGITLVELVAAMALTALFAVACVMLILPVSKIYTRSLEQNRVQIVADSVVDSLRSECSKAIITDTGDVWIADMDDYSGLIMDSAQPSSSGGKVLVFRRNNNYCETIASNYEIGDVVVNAILARDQAEADYKITEGDASRITSRSIYNMEASDKEAGLIHYGYYQSKTYEISLHGSTYPYVYPGEYYDFTNPFVRTTYLGCTVDLNFRDLTFDRDNLPAYVICDVTVNDDSGAAYSRSVALCFG